MGNVLDCTVSPLEILGEEEEEWKVQDSEEFRGLPDSPLWELQRRFYASERLRAWSEGLVPYFASSNGFVARVYADILVGAIRDFHRSRPPSSPRVPMYFVECGCGIGQLGFGVLEALRDMDDLILEIVSENDADSDDDSRWGFGDGEIRPYVYVLSDFTAAIVTEVMCEPRFQEHVERQTLDFAIFNCDSSPFPSPALSAPLHLTTLLHDTTLLPPTSTSPQPPLIFIGNYLISSLTHDAFFLQDGNMYRALLGMGGGDDVEEEFGEEGEGGEGEGGSEGERKSKRLGMVMESLVLRWKARRVQWEEEGKREEGDEGELSKRMEEEDGEDGEDGELRSSSGDGKIVLSEIPLADLDPLVVSLLQEYVKFDRLRERSLVLVPVGGMHFMRRVVESTKGNCLFLFGDRGYIDPLAMASQLLPPPIARHGSISFLANFHALAHLAQSIHPAPIARATRSAEGSFHVGLWAFGEVGGVGSDVGLAFGGLNSFGVGDWMVLLKEVKPHVSGMGLRQLQALLRLGGSDPEVLWRWRADWIGRSFPKESSGVALADARRDLAAVVRRMHSGAKDVAFEIGRMLMAMQLPLAAIPLFQRSILHAGPHHIPYHNIGICLVRVRRLREAVKAFDVAISLSTTSHPLHKPYQDSVKWRRDTLTLLAEEGVDLRGEGLVHAHEDLADLLKSPFDQDDDEDDEDDDDDDDDEDEDDEDEDEDDDDDASSSSSSSSSDTDSEETYRKRVEESPVEPEDAHLVVGSS